MSNKLSGRVIFGYALPAFALSAVGIPLYVYLPKFYSDVVGASVTAMGVILGVVRIFDAVTDPMIGFMSDRTDSRFGRRRPYLATFCVPLVVAVFFLLSPPELGPAVATWWFGVFVFIIFLLWTLVTVPYEALGPEISQDYNERTRLLGTRDGFLLAGTLAGVAAPAALGGISERLLPATGERATFLGMAILYAPLLLATCWICAWVVREPQRPPRSAQGINTLADIRAALSNRPFLILLGSYTLSAFGSNLPATLILYYVEYVLESQKTGLFLVLYMTCGGVFLPMWIKLAQSIGKKPAWLGAMALNTGAFFFVFFIGAGDELLYGILVVLSGVGFGATLALPSSMQADVIDYHELLTGSRSEGCYVGLWSISKKLAAALGVGIGLFALGRAGYVPNQPQAEPVKMTLRTMYAFVPCICNLAGLLIALKYPVSLQIHKKIQSAIRVRKSGGKVEDPLRPEQTVSART